MKIKSLLVIAFFSCFMFSCDKPVDLVTGHVLSSFTLDVDGVQRFGNLTIDTTLKAVIIPCDNNHTLRMYISDSLDLNSTQTYSMLIVNYSKAGHLKKQECYFEATTSATDTYLSTGSNIGAPNIFQFTPKPDQDHPLAVITHLSVQHFTSSPQPDSTYLSIDLEQLN